MNTETSQPSDQVNLTLTKWELANLHLPPVTTVTLYSGTAPVQFLRHRMSLILDKNPWLTSRIIKKSTKNGVVAMAYDENDDAGQQVKGFKGSDPLSEFGTGRALEKTAAYRCI